MLKGKGMWPKMFFIDLNTSKGHTSAKFAEGDDL